MKKPARISLFLIFFFSLTNSFGQHFIKGNVYNRKEVALQQASIVLEDSLTSETIDYSYTDENGFFTLQFNLYGLFNLTVRHLGYESKRMTLDFRSDQQQGDIIILLEEKLVELNEIIVHDKKPILVKNDTIRFNIKDFVNGTEQTVEDLLKKIPGLQIDSEGTIKIGNKEIEKIMVEGDDLFENRYKILSKNMPAYPIEEVELLKNYTRNQILKGIESSDKVALNLKLNEQSKNIWFGNVSASYDFNSLKRYNGQTNVMNFGRESKYYFLTNLNNTGYDATGDIGNLVTFGSSDPTSLGDDQIITNPISIDETQIGFDQSRTRFNNSRLVSLNAIHNPLKKVKVKSLALFNADNISFYSNDQDRFYTTHVVFLNTTESNLAVKNWNGFGQLNIEYTLSKNQKIEVTGSYKRGGSSNKTKLLFNGESITENLLDKSELVNGKLIYSNKLDDRKALVVTGRYIHAWSPQLYSTDTLLFSELSPDNFVNNVVQPVYNQFYYMGIEAHFFEKTGNGLFEFKVGDEFRQDKLESSLTLSQTDGGQYVPGTYANDIQYSVNNFFLKAKYRQGVSKRISFVGSVNLHQLHNRLILSESIRTQLPLFVNPSLGVDWIMPKEQKLMVKYSYNRTNAHLLDVYPHYILTGFRSFSKGADDFNQLTSSSLLLNYQLGNWSKETLINALVFFNRNHDFLSTNTTLNQNYTLSESVLIKNRSILNVSSTIDHFLRAVFTNIKGSLAFSQSDFKNVLNSQLRQVYSSEYSSSLELRSSFSGMFNYHIGTTWSKTKISASGIDSAFEDVFSFLDLLVSFSDKLNMSVRSEQYYFGNLPQGKNKYYFLDVEGRYVVKANKFIVSLSGKNLLGTSTFRSISITDFSTSITQYRLLPRFVLVKLEFRF